MRKDTKYTGAFVNSSAPTTSQIEGSYVANLSLARIDFNASQSNAIYGNSDTVQPPAVTVKYIIKH